MIKWAKEYGIWVLMVVFFLSVIALFVRQGSRESFSVDLKTSSKEFSGAMGTGETEGREGQSVFKLFYKKELVLEQTKEEVDAWYSQLKKDGQVTVEGVGGEKDWEKKSVNLIFDVTHSYREGVINEYDVQDRFERALAVLERESEHYLAKNIKIGFLGAEKLESGVRRVINKDVYTLNLDSYRQGILLHIKVNDGSFLKKKRKSSHYTLKGVELELIRDGVVDGASCKLNASSSNGGNDQQGSGSLEGDGASGTVVEKMEEGKNEAFICGGGVMPAVAKIREIGSRYFNDKYDRGTYLLEYLETNRDSFIRTGDFVIFSDGEFQFTEDVHAKNLNKLDSDYRISKRGYVYNSDNYINDLWFPRYWESAIAHIGYMTDFCKKERNAITFIGLSQTDNLPFIAFSREYLPKLFDGCKVEVR